VPVWRAAQSAPAYEFDQCIAW